MKSALIVLGVLVAFVVGIGFWAMGKYNKLVILDQDTNAKWAQVQNVYQRRADLIPNLVQTVQGAANFEKSTLTEVVNARASVGRVTMDASKAPTDAAQLAEFQKAQGSLSTALSRLLVVSEQYPDLKANANFRDLQAQLEGTENRITVERGRFNESVQGYNTAIKTAPVVFIAGIMGFKEKPYFTASEGAERAPAVKFDFNAPAKP
jgi:LemA protein